MIRIDNSLIASSDWGNEAMIKNILKLGHHSMNISNWNNTSEPSILAGSSIEVRGSIYIFDNDEAITDAVGKGKNFIITNGLTISYSSSFSELPEYDYKKKGYYDSSDNRIIGSFEYAGAYTEKKLYLDEYVPYLELETDTDDVYIDGNLLAVGGTCIVDNYTYGIGTSYGTTNIVYIFRTADNETYEKLFEKTGVKLYGKNINHANGHIVASIMNDDFELDKERIYTPIYSSDKINFTEKDWGLPAHFEYSNFLYANGNYVLLHYRYSVLLTSAIIAHSINLSAWTYTEESPVTQIVDSVTYNNLFIVSHSMADNKFKYSSDGVAWSFCNLEFTPLKYQVFTIDNSKLYSSVPGAPYSLKSTDGINFTGV